MDLIKKAAGKFQDNPALYTVNGTISFNELEEITARTGEILGQQEIGQGDIVGIVMPNSPSMVLLLLALMRRRSVAAPMNWRFPATRIQHALERLSPKAVIGPEVLTGALRFPAILTPEKLTAACETTASAVQHTDRSTAEACNEPSTIIHTSSSSGFPKAAVHSLANHYFSALGSNENIRFTTGDCWLLSLPLFHIGGYAILMRSLTGGGAVAIPAEERNIDAVLHRFPVTHLSLVPTQLNRLLDSPGSGNASKRLKAVLLGGSAVEPTLLQEASKAGLPVYLSYGSTEMSSQITTTPRPAATVTAGRPLRYREITIGAGNEILVKGPCLFQGYLSGTAPLLQIDEQGWFHTGDTGHLSPEGELQVTGRTDNMFISGGENIHPEEIERTLCDIPGIIRALVVPAADPELGFRPKAFIETSTHAPDNQKIQDQVSQLIGKLKTPVTITRIDTWRILPGTGKIDRGYYHLSE